MSSNNDSQPFIHLDRDSTVQPPNRSQKKKNEQMNSQKNSLTSQEMNQSDNENVSDNNNDLPLISNNQAQNNQGKSGDIVKDDDNVDQIPSDDASKERETLNILPEEDEKKKQVTKKSNTQNNKLQQENEALLEEWNEWKKKEREHLATIQKQKEILNGEKEAYLKQMKRLITENSTKEKNIKSISNANTILRDNWAKLSAQVEEIVDKTANKKKSNLSVEIKETEVSMDKILNVKENELINYKKFIDILTKDNKKLRGILESYGEINKKVELQNQWHDCKKESTKYSQEILTLKAYKDKYLKSEDRQKKLEENIFKLKLEVQEVKDKLEKNKLEYKTLQDKYYSSNKLTEKLREKRRSNEYKAKQEAQEIIKQKKEQADKEELYKTLTTNEAMISLFTTAEIDIWFKIFESNRDKGEAFASKIAIWARAKLARDNEWIIKISQKSKEINDFTKKCVFIEAKSADLDSLNKVLSMKWNENKNMINIYQRKINEFHEKFEQFTKTIKEQNTEKQMLLQQLSSLKAIMKDNAQEDEANENEEIVKSEVEKIKNEISRID